MDPTPSLHWTDHVWDWLAAHPGILYVVVAIGCTYWLGTTISRAIRARSE